MKLFKSWESYFYTLLLHPTKAMVWIKLNSNKNYCLPCIKINQGVWSSNFLLIKKAIEKEFEIAINILHYASFQVKRKQKEIQGIYVLEPCNLAPEIHDGIWCDRQTLDTISFSNLEHKSLIDSYLVELETGNIPELRPPWAQLGWYDRASDWMKQELERLDYEQLAPIEYVKSWSISCVLRVKTSKGTLYLKQASTLPLFCDEPVVTAELAKLFPNHIPRVMSINREHGWLLLQDFGEPIGNQSSLKAKQDIYRLLAQIQIQSVEHRDRLLTLGCLDRRLKRLQSQIDPLINYAVNICELSAPEIDQLSELAPYLQSLCCQLEDYNIPETLVHGDLHLHNVAFNEGDYLLFDWTDSCITHPFFDLFDLFFAAKGHSWWVCVQSLGKQNTLKHLQNTYLGQWLEYESGERLLEAWKLAKPLCALHHAVTYQYIMANLEPRSKHEFNHALPNFLREMIKSTSQLRAKL